MLLSGMEVMPTFTGFEDESDKVSEAIKEHLAHLPGEALVLSARDLARDSWVIRRGRDKARIDP